MKKTKIGTFTYVKENKPKPMTSTPKQEAPKMTPQDKKEEWRERFVSLLNKYGLTIFFDTYKMRMVKEFIEKELALAKKEGYAEGYNYGLAHGVGDRQLTEMMERERIVEDYIKHLVENECKKVRDMQRWA